VELDADASLTSVDPVSVLLHQAADQTIPLILSATQHWSKFPTTTAPLPAHLVRQTCPIPLLKGASGLVVLTQDWRFARTLKDDQHQLEQEYIVDVTGQLHPDGLKQLSQALRQQSTTRSSCKVSWQSENRLRFALKAPQDHQIQHQCAQVGLQVTAMRRIRIGAVSMGKLPLHHWMYLSPKQRF
ncbi:MAG: RNA-binding protein, partial [Pseudomonadota bacterium]|nr:RNA-binding protein [Pseudomonadota bacterium]